MLLPARFHFALASGWCAGRGWAHLFEKLLGLGEEGKRIRCVRLFGATIYSGAQVMLLMSRKQ